MQEDFKVYVSCMTYNQSAYICDALDGFCMQMTDFPFICGIIDDCSTDGEEDIIQSYLQRNFILDDMDCVLNEETDDYVLTLARHRVNINCFFLVIFLKYNHYKKKAKKPYVERWYNTKYVAVCEGDDFWVSPHKLQRQVDFLDTHPSHSFCFHASYDIFNDGVKKEKVQYNDDMENVPIQDLIRGGGSFMATNSILYVRRYRNSWPAWTIKFPVGDTPLMLGLAVQGSVGYVNEIMSCYRIAADNSWTSRQLRNGKLRKESYQKNIIAWKAFDEGTGYKYHEAVNERLRKITVHYLLRTVLGNKVMTLLSKK